MKTILPYSVLISLVLLGCGTYSKVFINSDGEMKRCSATGQGLIGLAVAANSAGNCYDDLISAGYIEIDSAGVIGVDFTSSVRDTVAKVLKVYDPSPAKFAGIQPGDIVTLVDGAQIESTRDAKRLIFGKIGRRVDVTVLRNGESKQCRLTLAPYKQIFRITSK